MSLLDRTTQEYRTYGSLGGREHCPPIPTDRSLAVAVTVATLLYTQMWHDVCMKRTTIEIDEELLARAKRALRLDTTRATVEEALRQAADRAESEHTERAGRQRRYLEGLSSRADLVLLASAEMWR